MVLHYSISQKGHIKFFSLLLICSFFILVVYFYTSYRGADVMTDDCKAIVDFLSCDYEVFINENGDKIIKRWKELAEHGKREGFFPLLIVPDKVLVEGLGYKLKDAGVEKAPEGMAGFREAILREAESIDARAFFNEYIFVRVRLLQGWREFVDSGAEITPESITEFREAVLREAKKADVVRAFIDEYWVKYSGELGEFISCEPNDRFYLSKMAHPEILIAKIPAEHPWELAAWVPMGGWNECPSPAQQAAVFKYWNEKYGAVPDTVTHDIWEMQLTKPPVTNEEAEALAKEHFAFCSDLAEVKVREFASMLKKSTTWFFWWD